MKVITTIVLCLLTSIMSFSQKQRIKVNGKNRSFILYVPKSVDSQKAVPLVFNFHGGGMSASEQMLYTNMNATAEANQFIVVYPKGIKGNWNVGFDEDYDTGTDDIGYVKELLEKIKETYKIDADAIFATGLSRGGFFTYRLAVEMPAIFSAIAPIGAPMPIKVKERHTNNKEVAVLLAQGNADESVKFTGKPLAYLSAEATIEYWLKHNKNLAKAKEKTIDIVTDETKVIIKKYKEKYDVVLIEIENGGHTWPGANDFNLGYSLGKTTHDIDINQVIWDFFDSNRKH